MYDAPIEIYTMADEIVERMNEAIENEVLEAIFRVGVNVDKEELIKALSYDREQYVKGYADGTKEFAERVKELLKRECSTMVYMYLAELVDTIVKEMGKI